MNVRGTFGHISHLSYTRNEMKVDSALSLPNKIHCVTLFLMCFPGMDCYSVEVCLRGSSVTASLKTALSNIYISSGGHMKNEESRLLNEWTQHVRYVVNESLRRTLVTMKIMN